MESKTGLKGVDEPLPRGVFLILSIMPIDAHAHLGNIWGGGEWANGVALPPQSLFVFRL